jgi:hypothetical protein
MGLGSGSTSALNHGRKPIFVAVQHEEKYKRGSQVCKGVLLLCSILELLA